MGERGPTGNLLHVITDPLKVGMDERGPTGNLLHLITDPLKVGHG